MLCDQACLAARFWAAVKRWGCRTSFMYNSLFQKYHQKQMLRNGGRYRQENFPQHIDIAGASRADLQSPASFGAF